MLFERAAGRLHLLNRIARTDGQTYFTVVMKRKASDAYITAGSLDLMGNVLICQQKQTTALSKTRFGSLLIPFAKKPGFYGHTWVLRTWSRSTCPDSNGCEFRNPIDTSLGVTKRRTINRLLREELIRRFRISCTQRLTPTIGLKPGKRKVSEARTSGICITRGISTLNFLPRIQIMV